jgi:acyl-CoA synthetase (NDP forming)
VPFYGTVEEAVLALRRVTDYADWRRRDAGEVPELDDVHPSLARAVVAQVLSAGEDRDTDVLPVVTLAGPAPYVTDTDSDRVSAPAADDAADDAGYEGDRETLEVRLHATHPDDHLSRLLAAYGIEVWPVTPVASEEQAVAAAGRLGFPVVLKTLDPRLASRLDLGAVRLNIENERAVQTAYLSMVASLDSEAVRHLVVQRMAAAGVACVIGSVEDPLFGPVVSFGLAGVVPELLGDRGFRIPPLTDADARDLIATPGASPLLDGFGGTQPVDKAALEDLLVRVGQIADDLPEIAELRLDPVVVSPSGLAVLGAQAVLRRASARPDSGARRLGS